MTTAQPHPGIEPPPPPGHRWRRHPALATALRVAIVVVPIVCSLAVAILLARAVPRPADTGTTVLWLAIIVVTAMLTLVVLEQAASRLLPLAALLQVSLLFPDDAPRRFAVARRTGGGRKLQQQLRQATEAGDQDDAARLRTVVELLLALSVHDRATRGHSERVRVYTELIADQLRLSPPARDRLRWASILHDVGKLAVPAATLNQRSPLTAEDWAAVRRHPAEGAHLVAPLLEWMDVWGLAVEQHHERFDGSGYPRGLRAQQISLGGRIVAVADAYEVMTAPRAYKRVMSVAAARIELAQGAGSQFDPTVVRGFLNVSIGRLWRVIGIGALAAQLPLVGGVAARVRDWTTPTFAAGAAIALVALSGSPATSFPVVPPGQVAGIQAPRPAQTPDPPTRSSIPIAAPSVSASATLTPVPFSAPPLTIPHYPYVFTMAPLPRR
jgi:hypothetical protein